MRKLILISALILASASAQAGESRGLVLAASDPMAASTTDSLPQPLPPVAKSDAQQPRQQPASEPAAPRARPNSQARRHESNEAMARRIAARYGISW